MRTLSPLGASLHPVRLACLIHAASVHSEPGSNSPLKKSLTCDSGSTFKVGRRPESHEARGAPHTALRCPISKERENFLHRFRRGPYFKPVFGDCKPLREDFSSFFAFFAFFSSFRGFSAVFGAGGACSGRRGARLRDDRRGTLLRPCGLRRAGVGRGGLGTWDGACSVCGGPPPRRPTRDGVAARLIRLLLSHRLEILPHLLIHQLLQFL